MGYGDILKSILHFWHHMLPVLNVQRPTVSEGMVSARGDEGCTLYSLLWLTSLNPKEWALSGLCVWL
jgi:hypothetical protein